MRPRTQPLRRSRAMVHALDALRALMRAPHTAAELGAELGFSPRSAYRLIEQLREAGVEVAESEGDYSIRPETVRKRLGLRVR